VPFKAKFYGSINCFLSTCVRRKDRGFKTEVEMRMHARSRHRMQYQADVETQNAAKTDEVAILRQRLDSLMSFQANGAAQPERRPHRSNEEVEAARARMAKARAARKPVAVAT
jgi:hypothetical protein